MMFKSGMLITNRFMNFIIVGTNNVIDPSINICQISYIFFFFSFFIYTELWNQTVFKGFTKTYFLFSQIWTHCKFLFSLFIFISHSAVYLHPKGNMIANEQPREEARLRGSSRITLCAKVPRQKESRREQCKITLKT